MAEIKSPIDKIKPLLERIKIHLAWAKGNTDNLSYKIEYCCAIDKDWHFAQKGTDPNLFIKTCKEVVSKIGADAVQVTTYMNNKVSECEIIRITDCVVPFLDEHTKRENNEDRLNSRDSSQHLAPYFDKLTDVIKQSGLNGTNDFVLQGIQRDSDNQIKILQIQHENTIERLHDKMELLNEKMADKSSYVEELESEIEQLEEMIKGLQSEVSVKKQNSGKRQDFLLAAGLGKMFKMENHEIIGLAGLLSGNETPQKAETGKEELLSPDQSHPHHESNGKRGEDISTIIGWLKNDLDDTRFQYVCFILSTLAARPDLYEEIVKQLEDSAKVPISNEASAEIEENKSE